uniref:Uncharacterized protein n=1 Tax=Mustela putorius furo TaxID=9669 RepID=M3YLH8_MUSPF
MQSSPPETRRSRRSLSQPGTLGPGSPQRARAEGVRLGEGRRNAGAASGPRRGGAHARGAERQAPRVAEEPETRFGGLGSLPPEASGGRAPGVPRHAPSRGGERGRRPSGEVGRPWAAAGPSGRVCAAVVSKMR